MTTSHLFLQLLILQSKVNLRVRNVHSFTRLWKHLLYPSSLLLFLFSHGDLSLNRRDRGVIGCVVIRMIPLHAFLRIEAISGLGNIWFAVSAMDHLGVAKDGLRLIGTVCIRLTISLIGERRIGMPFKHLLGGSLIQPHGLTSHREGTLSSCSIKGTTHHHHLLLRLREHLRRERRLWLIELVLAVRWEALIGIKSISATEKLRFEPRVTA